MTEPLLLLLDGHSLAYRAFFALPVENFSTTTGQPTNAVYGFTSMLINVLRDEQPTHLAVAFDAGGGTFRHEEYAGYKATRSETPSDFRGQVGLVKEVLDALRVPVLSVPGVEADDVLATLAVRASGQGMRVLLVTGDRDALQLVDEHVTVLMTRRGISDMTRFTPQEVQEKYGLTPTQYPDFAALRGDPSDNLPGIPGVGEKTAARWVREFGSLEQLVARVDEVGGKTGGALRERLGDVVRNRRLTELRRDVPLDRDPDELRLGQWDREAVHTLFDTLQFRVLRERLYATLSAAEPEAEEGFEVSLDRPAPGTLGSWLAEHAGASALSRVPDAASRRVGLAVDATAARGTGAVHRLSLACPDGSAAVLATSDLDGADDAALAAWLADPDVPVVVHEVKPLLWAFAGSGWRLEGLVCDTELAAYLALPGQRQFDLADLALRYLRRELRVESGEAPGGDPGPADADQLELDVTGDDEELAARRLAVRARAAADLSVALEDDLVRRGGLSLLRDVELPLARVLARLETVGIAVDHDHLESMEATLAASVAAAVADAHASVGHEFNLGSPKQLQAVLFDELGLPKTKRIKTGYTTDADSLVWLQTHSEHPVLSHLLHHRDVVRLKTVVDGLLAAVADDGRVHTTFQQTVAATGRLSSTDPNLQNIPIRTETGRQIRRAFVVGAGFESLMTADYSQIEMRIMAHLSGDETLREAFRSGEDLHSYVASTAYGIPVADVDPEMRRRIKAMSYGLAYGLSAYGLGNQLGISPDEARDQMDTYFERFGGVRDYLRDVVARARSDGYTETVMGRRRYLPDLVSDNGQRRQMAERMALNAPIQGGAADVIKVAMLRVDDALAVRGLASRVLLQVHDELVCEVAPGEREELEELLRDAMGGALQMTVPLEVGVGVGRDWDAAAH